MLNELNSVLSKMRCLFHWACLLALSVVFMCMPVLVFAVDHTGENEAGTLTLRYDPGTGRYTKVSSGQLSVDQQTLSADLYWRSESESVPTIGFCGAERLRIAEDESMVVARLLPGEQGEACYQLQFLQPEGRITLHDLDADWQQYSFIDTSEAVPGWMVHFRLSPDSVAPGAFPDNTHSGNQYAFRASNDSAPWLPPAQPRFRSSLLVSGDGGDRGDFPDKPYRPGFPDAQESLLQVFPVIGNEQLPSVDWSWRKLFSNLWWLTYGSVAERHFDEMASDESTGYAIQVQTCHGKKTSILTRDEWRALVRQGGVTAEGIMAFLDQKEQNRWQHDQWYEELQDRLENQERDEEEIFSAGSEIHTLLEQLTAPVTVDVSLCGDFQVPGIIQLGGGGKESGKQTRDGEGASGSKGSRQTTAPCASIGSVSTKGSGGGGAPGGEKTPPEAESTELVSSAEELNLARILESFRGFDLLSHGRLLMAFYGQGLLSFDTAVVLVMARESDQKTKVKELAAAITDINEKILFLQLTYFHLNSEGYYREYLTDFIESIPQAYRKAVQQHFKLNIPFPQDEEAALEALRRVTSVAFPNYSYIKALKRSFAVEVQSSSDSAHLNQCHSQGIAGYRLLYRTAEFRKFFETHLPPAFIDWLKGGASPWPEPELSIIGSAEMAMAMPGLSRLDSWDTFLLEAYGNSALTFHQFKALVELPGIKRYEALRQVAATLDMRRAARFLLSLVELLRKQHPLLAEQLTRQADEGVRSILTSSMGVLPLPEETGEGDHWRRAFAASLSHYHDLDSVLTLENCLISNFVVESAGLDLNKKLIERKCQLVVRLLSEFSTSRNHPGRGIKRALEGAGNSQGLRIYLNMLESLARGRPSLLRQRPVESAGGDSQPIAKIKTPSVDCPVCLEDMSACPSVLCRVCENVLCLECGKRLCKERRGECPQCRKTELVIPRQFRHDAD